jgi:protein-S-isoprenylcysteine O-methyltransferase Ste14
LRPGRASRYALLLGGLIVYLVGMALAVAGRVALGSSYRPSSSVGATLAPDHRLVTSGPFAVVRHPMYLGLALAAIGALAVYRTWSTVLFVVQLPVLVARARREEELLARTFGEAWRRYAARVPAWLPRTRPIAVSRALAGERPVSAFVPGAAAGTLRHPQAVAPEAT